MAENSKIEWTTHTWNPWRGCTKVSPGCAHCYAETMSARNPKTLGVWGPNGTRVVASEAMWREPLKWDKAAACTCNAALGKSHMTAFATCPQHAGPHSRPRVFCASLADVFEADDTMPTAFIGRVHAARMRLFGLIEQTPHLDWLLLTKRPENIRLTLARCGADLPTDAPGSALLLNWLRGTAPANVWLGTSAENQACYDYRFRALADVPAVVRFISGEPLLAELVLRAYCPHCRSFLLRSLSPTCGTCHGPTVRPDWMIVGGESGARARPMQLEWARALVAQCQAAGVSVFVKQLGAMPCSEDDTDAVNSANGTRFALNTILLEDKKGGDMAEWPADLRVREFPRVAA